ncbi:MAG: hypothetical protein GY898_03160 [Proteobacteria bacterium]|nr:hypothetical protein [Pseudomonadota bacterium]
MFRFSLALTAIASLSLLAACSDVRPDNSGGPPPEGDALEFAVLEDAPALFCGIFEDEADIDAWLEACEASEEGDRDAILGELEALNDDESLVLVSVVLGGCLGQTNLQAVHLDGDVLRPWLLKADSAYGKDNVGCTADIGEQIYVLAVQDEQASTSAEVHVGVYNPDLPGAPIVDQE